MEGISGIHSVKRKVFWWSLFDKELWSLVINPPVRPPCSDESPAPAADGSQLPEPAESPSSEPTSRAHEYAQRADHATAAAAETSASEDPDGERED